MLRNLLLSGVFSAAAWAAPITFTFGGSGVMADGASLASTISGLTVTVTAWSTTGNGGGAGGTLQTARIGRYGTNGIGICNDNEGTCPSNEHTVDNNGASDFMLFVFSTPVDLQSLGITSWGDTDITYFTGVSGFAGPLGYTVANIDDLAGNGWTRRSDIVNAPALPSTISLTGTNVTALLLGARTPDVVCSQTSPTCNVDRFKIRTLTVEVPPGEEEVPEPATMFLTGGGLIAAALIRRNRK